MYFDARWLYFASDIYSFPVIHGDIDYEEMEDFEFEFVTTLGLKITKSLETNNN